MDTRPQGLPSWARRRSPASSLSPTGARSRQPGSMYRVQRSGGSMMWMSLSRTLKLPCAIAAPPCGRKTYVPSPSLSKTARPAGAASLDHRVGQLSEALDPQADGVAALEKSLPANAHAGGRPGQDHVAGLQGHARGQHGDLLGRGEDHPAGMRVLHQLVVDPELQAEVLRIGHLARRHDPRPQRAGAVEALLTQPVEMERRGRGILDAG